MVALLAPVTKADHIRGERDAPVTLVVYGDYEHPRSAKAHESIRQIQQDIGDVVRYVFRNFPLARLHSNALHAAFAAEAASLQGKFWPMHDQLYQHQDALEDQELIGYAANAGLELEQFISDMGSIDVRFKVRRDVDGGVRSGISMVPTFYINNQLQQHGKAYDYAILRAALEDAIQQSELARIL